MRQLMEGFVYFAQAPDGGPVKIGWSTDPKSRVEAFPKASRPRVIGLFRAQKTVETVVKFLLARFQTDEHDTMGQSGMTEWFQPTPEVLRWARNGEQMLERVSASALTGDDAQERPLVVVTRSPFAVPCAVTDAAE